MAFLDDFSVAANGDIRHVSGTTVYDVLELHAALQASACLAAPVSDDVVSILTPNPSKIDGPRDPLVATRLNLLSSGSVQYNLDDTAVRFINFGSVKQFSAQTLYSGLKTVGTIVDESPIYVVQAGTKLVTYWPDGHLRIMVRVRTGGTLTDGGVVTAYSRKWGQTYSHFDVDLSAGGESAAAISTSIDTNVIISEAAAAALVSKVAITIESADHDLGNGNGLRPYTGKIVLDDIAIQDVYHVLKYLTREDSSANIGVVGGGTVPGWRFRGLSPSYPENPAAPFGSYAGGKLFFAQGWWVEGVRPEDGLRYQLVDATGVAQDPPIPALERGINLTDLIPGSQVVVFDNGTQTVIASTETSGTTFLWSEVASGGRSLAYTVMKVGYVPVRATGVVVNGAVTSISIQQQVDRAYVPSTGLAYTTDVVVNTTTKTVRVFTPTALQNLYSFLIEQWIARTEFRNSRFPFLTNGPNSFTLYNGYEMFDQASLDKLSRDGLRYLSVAEEVTAIWAGVLSLGDAVGATAEFQRVLGAAPIDAVAPGPVDQLIQVYGDATHGNFDTRNYLRVKMQPNGYRPAEVVVTDLYGSLEDQFYIISMAPVLIPDITPGNPGVSGITVTNHGASPVTWNAGNGNKNYSITIEDAGTNTAQQIHEFINYSLSLDATFFGSDPFNWPELIVDTGSSHETARGTILGSAGALLKGVRVIRTGGTPHPDFERFQADDGTYGITPTQTGLVIDGLLTGSAVYIFDGGTQTQLAGTSNSGTSLSWSETYVSDRTVDYTVIKAGYTPIRGSFLAVSGVGSVTVQQVFDRSYEASSGLTYGTTMVLNAGTKRITLSALTTTRNLYSAMIEAWRDQLALRNVAFPVDPDGPTSFSFEQWEFLDATTRSYLSRGGIRYTNAGNVTAIFAAIQTSVLPPGSKVWGLQQDGGAWNLLSTGTGFDGVVQTYGDATHGNFDRRNFFALKATNDGYTIDESDLINDLGNAAIVDIAYFAPLNIVLTGAATGNPGALGIVVNNLNNVSWNGITVGQEVVVPPGVPGTDVLRWLTWQRHQGNLLTYGSLVLTQGDKFRSVRGRVYDGTPLEIEGTRVVLSTDGTTVHPDFVLFEGNGTSEYIPPVQAVWSVTNIIVGSRVFVKNVTQNAVRYNGIAATSTITANYLNGTDFNTNDAVEVRIMLVTGVTAKMEFTGQAVATAQGWSVGALQVDCPVYNLYGVNGSLVTEYAPDFPNVQVDINDPDNRWSAKRFYAWYKNILFSSAGIDQWWGAVTAIDAANLRINTEIVDLFFDNVKNVSATPEDDIRVFRSDGLYPQATPTSGGGGIGFFATGTIFIASVNTGSGVTPADVTSIASAVWNRTKASHVTAGTMGKSLADSESAAKLAAALAAAG